MAPTLQGTMHTLADLVSEWLTWEELKGMRLVCADFDTGIQSAILRRSLRVHCVFTPASTFGGLYRLCYRLTLAVTSDVLDSLVWPPLPHLRRLQINTCVTRLPSQMTANLPNLSSVFLLGLEHLDRGLSSLTQLTMLDVALQTVRTVDDDALPASLRHLRILGHYSSLPNSLGMLSELRTLTMSMPDDGQAQLVNNLRNLANLTVLTVDNQRQGKRWRVGSVDDLNFVKRRQ
jgi:hypothetical protein